MASVDAHQLNKLKPLFLTIYAAILLALISTSQSYRIQSWTGGANSTIPMAFAQKADDLDMMWILLLGIILVLVSSIAIDYVLVGEAPRWRKTNKLLSLAVVVSSLFLAILLLLHLGGTRDQSSILDEVFLTSSFPFLRIVAAAVLTGGVIVFMGVLVGINFSAGASRKPDATEKTTH